MQERAVQEIMEVFPTDETEIDYEKIQKLVYLEMVVKEHYVFAPLCR